MRTLSELAQQALTIQDACNPLGLTKGYAEALQELTDILRASGSSFDTAAICAHPINRLWASKLHSLAGLGTLSHIRYVDALKYCQRVVDAADST